MPPPRGEPPGAAAPGGGGARPLPRLPRLRHVAGDLPPPRLLLFVVGLRPQRPRPRRRTLRRPTAGTEAAVRPLPPEPVVRPEDDRSCPA